MAARLAVVRVSGQDDLSAYAALSRDTRGTESR
jgi:hypothetical protein